MSIYGTVNEGYVSQPAYAGWNVVRFQDTMQSSGDMLRADHVGRAPDATEVETVDGGVGEPFVQSSRPIACQSAFHVVLYPTAPGTA